MLKKSTFAISFGKNHLSNAKKFQMHVPSTYLDVLKEEVENHWLRHWLFEYVVERLFVLYYHFTLA